MKNKKEIKSEIKKEIKSEIKNENVTENAPLALPKEQVDKVLGLYSSGKIDEAIEMIKALNEDYPNVPLLFNLLGACYNKLEQFDPAAQFFEAAISIKPDYAEAFLNHGIVMRQVDNH